MLLLIFSIFTDISVIINDISIKIGFISSIYQEYIGDDPTVEIMKTRGRLRFCLVFSKPPTTTCGFDGHN